MLLEMKAADPVAALLALLSDSLARDEELKHAEPTRNNLDKLAFAEGATAAYTDALRVLGADEDAISALYRPYQKTY